jgi:hypothetical protein
MRTILGLLLLLATPLSARDPYPDDYTPSPCATPEAIARVAKTFPQSQIHDIASMRGADIGQEWVDAHWKELSEGLAPIWAKIATCYTTAGNTNLFCNDAAMPAAFGICNRYPEGSRDRERCIYSMTAILHGQDLNSKAIWTELRNCAAAKHPASQDERTFDWWLVPETFGDGYPGHFTVYAIDSETRVPVQARLILESTVPIYSEDSADGLPTTFFKVPWKPKLVRVPNAQGHRDVLPPAVTIQAPGYRIITFRLPMTVPSMTVTMTPAKLRRGKNSVTITAVDATTGKPVEARVMGGQHVLGKTNVPFELEVTGKAPEIWVTNLYDRYNDVVVAPAQ